MSDCEKLRKQLKHRVYSKKLVPEQCRENYECFFNDVFLPNEVECATEQVAGENVLVLTPMVKNAKQCVLYFHGGFFEIGTQKSYTGFCASLANACQAEVVLPEIVPAYEEPFPFQLEAAYRVYRGLQQSERFAGYHFVFAGDGSGATLCFALALYVLDKEEKLPLGIAVMSPLVDLQIKKIKHKDGLLSFELFERYVKNYAGDKDTANPLISPSLAELSVLKKIPAVFVQAIRDEYLFDQINTFVSQLEKADVTVETENFSSEMTMFQLFPDACKTAHLAVESFAKKIMEMFSHTFGEKDR